MLRGGLKACGREIFLGKCSFEAKFFVIKFGFDYISAKENFPEAVKKNLLILDFSGSLRAEGILPENDRANDRSESGASDSYCGLENGCLSDPDNPINLLKVSLQITASNDSAEIEAEVLDLRGLEGTRCYCDEAAEEEIVRRIAPFRYGGERWREFPIHFIDTGEYHYLSKFFVDTIDVPFTLLVLDNHTDMQEPAFGEGLLSCGGWLADVMRSPKALQAVILAGPGGRIALYEPCDTFGADGEKCGNFLLVETEELSAEGMKNICDKISIDNLYVSIDKDVMSVDCYRTGWSQGELSLDELKLILSRLLEEYSGSLLGIDICGGLPEAQPALTCDLALNRRTDLALLAALLTK